MYYKCIPNLFFSKGKWRDFREQMQWKCQSICTKQNYSWAKKLRASSPLTREGKNIVNPILSFWEFYSPVKLQAFKNRHQESIKAHRMEKKKIQYKAQQVFGVPGMNWNQDNYSENLTHTNKFYMTVTYLQCLKDTSSSATCWIQQYLPNIALWCLKNLI